MTESRSLMVRSGMMTSFCATTVVTPFFVTVFMRGKKEGKREREKETVYGMLKDRGALMMSEKETKKKSGVRASEFAFYGDGVFNLTQKSSQ